MSLSFVSFVLIRYLHFIAVIALFVLLLAEFVQMKPTLSGKSLRRLANTDLAYWLATRCTWTSASWTNVAQTSWATSITGWWT